MKSENSVAKSQIAPAPWRNDYQPSSGFGSGYGKSQIIDALNRPIAAVALVAPENGEMYSGNTISEETFDLMEANARLIATAPEMLAVLEKVDKHFWLSGDFDGKSELHDEVRLAIKKARGEIV